MDRIYRRLWWLLSTFMRSELGASAVEWSVLAALIAAVIVVIVTSVGLNLQALYARALAAISLFM